VIAYLRHVGSYGQPISSFWQQQVYPWMVTNNLLQRPRYGISHDDPNITAPEQCRYDAGVEVPAQSELSGPAFRTTIPGGRYASAYFNGTVHQIGDAWTAVLRDWLPPSGMKLDGRPSFEYYPPGSSFDAATGAFDCHICIPVTPL
jgi:AraC family transcriptional regulator